MARIELDLTNVELELYLQDLRKSIEERGTRIKTGYKKLAYRQSLKDISRAEFWTDLIAKMETKQSVEQRILAQLERSEVAA